MDISALLDKNGTPSSRKLTPGVCAELVSATPWLLPEAQPAERMWCLAKGISSYPVLCKHCSKPVAWCSWTAGYNREFCCKPCFFEYRRAHPKQTTTQTERLSVEELRSRREASNLRRYGVRYPWMLDEFKKKKAELGYVKLASSWQHELLGKGYTPLFDINEYRGNRTALNVRHDACGTVFALQRQRTGEMEKQCPTCWSRRASKGQHDLADWIKTLGVKVRLNERTVFKGKLEIDIYVNEHRLAIEYDGLYWHSEKGRPDIKEMSQRKLDLFRANDLRSIMVFDDEWEHKQAIVKSRIKNALGLSDRSIAARQCTVEKLTSVVQRKFLSENHLQGGIAAALAYGLYNKTELVAVMSFGRSRFSSKQEWELLRFATKASTSVMGGASRLFSAWRREHPASSIVSFSDNRWGTGGFYTHLGFKNDGQTGQGYFYVDSNGNRRSRQSMQKHKLNDQLKTFDPSLTERDNCWNNGWYRVWDLGNTRWVIGTTAP